MNKECTSASSIKNGERLYNLNNEFLELLKTVRPIEIPVRLSQILDYMREYIQKRRLFDPKNLMIIHCEDDPLGKVFGVNDFTIQEVENLVLRQISIVNSQKCVAAERSPGEESVRKRPRRDSYSVESSPMYLFIPATPEYSSSAETELSIQARETDIVKDSSDDLWFLEEDDVETASITIDDDHFALEFEVESETDHSSSPYSSASDIEDVVHAAALILHDDDTDFWADSSDLSSDAYDSELDDLDMWLCKKCGSKNFPPLRYCQHCWNERIGWLPDRGDRHPPRRQRYRKRKNRKSKKQHSEVEIKEDERSELSDISKSSPSELASSQSISGSQSSNCDDPKSSCIYEEPKCNLCFIRPICASIVHGRTGHRYACFKCSNKLLEKNRRCPVCRRTIERVIRNF